MATPEAVPFSRSSNFDCSQERVPCAKTTTDTAHHNKRPLKTIRDDLSTLCKFIPRFQDPGNAGWKATGFSQNNQGITQEPHCAALFLGTFADFLGVLSGLEVGLAYPVARREFTYFVILSC